MSDRFGRGKEFENGKGIDRIEFNGRSQNYTPHSLITASLGHAYTYTMSLVFLYPHFLFFVSAPS